MLKKIVFGAVGLALLASPFIASAQTTSTSSEAAIVADFIQLIQFLEEELQQLIALHNSAPATHPTTNTDSNGFTATSTSGSAPFTITPPNSQSSLTSITPSAGTAGTEFTISGTNLSGASSIQFYNSAGQLVSTFPASSLSVTSSNVSFTLSGGFVGLVGAGTYQLDLVTPYGTSNALTFVVTSPSVSPSPAINSINPNTITTNTPVTISGSNLSGASSMQIYNSAGVLVATDPASSFSTVTPTSVSFALNGSFLGLVGAGTYQLDLVTPYGTSNALTFVVLRRLVSVHLPQ